MMIRIDSKRKIFHVGRYIIDGHTKSRFLTKIVNNKKTIRVRAFSPFKGKSFIAGRKSASIAFCEGFSNFLFEKVLRRSIAVPANFGDFLGERSV